MTLRVHLGMGPAGRVATILFFTALLCLTVAGLSAWRWWAVAIAAPCVLSVAYLAMGRVRYLTIYRGGADWYASILRGHLWCPKQAEIHRLAGDPDFTVRPATGPFDESFFELVLAGAERPLRLGLYRSRTEAELVARRF